MKTLELLVDLDIQLKIAYAYFGLYDKIKNCQYVKCPICIITKRANKLHSCTDDERKNCC